MRNDDFFCEKYGDNIISHTLSNGCLFNLFGRDLGFKDGDDSGKVMGMSSYYWMQKDYYLYYIQRKILDGGERLSGLEEMNGVWITTKELHDNLSTDEYYPFERTSFELNLIL